MLGNIIDINGNLVKVKLSINIRVQTNLINLYVVFENNNEKIVGTITSINFEEAIINILGEISNNVFIPGIIKKPVFKAIVRLITLDELNLIFGEQSLGSNKQIRLGSSIIYNNYQVNIPINNFFSNHFAIIGNTGSGKSYAVARLLQNLFSSNDFVPTKANLFIFDAFGEYNNSFKDINKKNSMINYKYYATNHDDQENLLRIPLWLLGVDDLALLLNVDNPIQLPIIEKALKLVVVLRNEQQDVTSHKNDIIARCLLSILLSGTDSSKIRDQVIAILTKFNTKELNLDSLIVQPGYTRTLKQCLIIDKLGKLQEIETVVDFIKQFIIEGLELRNPDGTVYYTLSDLEQALDFALISEGIFRSNRVYDYANVLAVRLHALVNSQEGEYFSFKNMISREQYILSLLANKEGKKCQIINFNINNVDDRLAKVIVKIISKMLFDYATKNVNRGNDPFHILIEEAHRYVQNDLDNQILNYNIFERITKEGRKYGVLLGLITQRPSELSQTAISQCANFLILRTQHPLDLDFIKNMIPNVTTQIIEDLKILQPGTCVAFGNAFLIPIIVKISLPEPVPLSSNVDIIKAWYN